MAHDCLVEFACFLFKVDSATRLALLVPIMAKAMFVHGGQVDAALTRAIVLVVQVTNAIRVDEPSGKCPLL